MQNLMSKDSFFFQTGFRNAAYYLVVLHDCSTLYYFILYYIGILTESLNKSKIHNQIG